MFFAKVKCLICLFGLLLIVGCNSHKGSSDLAKEKDSVVQVDEVSLNENNAEEGQMTSDAQTFELQGRTVLVSNCAIDIKIDPKESDPRIKDPCADKPIAADIEISNTQGEIVRQLKSNRVGEFSVKMPKGEYIIRTKANAFITESKKQLLLDSNQSITLIVKVKMPPVR